MPTTVSERCEINGLLDELESNARAQHPAGRKGGAWVCQRRDPRHPFRTDCVIHFYPADGAALATAQGRTRNLSRNGLGLLTRQTLAAGETVEVEVTVPARGTMFMLGVVTFSRYAGQSYHEVGLSLKTVKPHAMLPRRRESEKSESAA